MHQHSLLMANAGHRVSVIAGRGERTDPRVDFIQLPLVDSRAPAILAAKRELDQGRIPEDFAALSDEIENELRGHIKNADWIMAHNVCSLNKNLPLTAALRRIAESGLGPMIGLWHHDLAWTTPRYRDELHTGYPWDLLRKDWPNSIQITVSAHRARELRELLNVPEDRVRVIPNGLDARAFLRLGPEALHLVNDLRLLDGDPLILLPARITPRKNIEMALRILASLLERHPSAKLLVTGPTGPHNPANAAYLASLVGLRKELGIEEQAVLLALTRSEAVSDELLLDLYRLADVLLFPSREEGFGIPPLEAGLERIPVFCADIEPLREVGGSEVEYFPPDGDVPSIAERLGMMLSADKRHRLRKRVLRQYDWQSIYSQQIAPLLEARR